MLNFTFSSLFFFCPVSSGGSSTSRHQDLHPITQNILCLFPFKPVKDQVLPSSGSLFLFNLDVPDTYWCNILLQRLFLSAERTGVLQEGKTVKSQKSLHSSGSSLFW